MSSRVLAQREREGGPEGTFIREPYSVLGDGPHPSEMDGSSVRRGVYFHVHFAAARTCELVTETRGLSCRLACLISRETFKRPY